MPRTTKSISNSRPARRIERVDDLGIDQRVALAPNRRRPAGPGELDLFFDVTQQLLLQRERRDRQQLEPVRLGVAGDEIEHARDVAADRRVGGEQRHVGIDARRDRVIVAGAEMAIRDERAGFAPDHHRQLGVGLQFDEPEYNLRAGALEVARPANVGLLVEPRFQLDQRRHRFAGFRRLDQGADDRAVGRRAIERLLDRHNIGIARRLEQELHDDVEQLVGVMDNQVLLPDRHEAVAAIVAHPLGEARIEQGELELRPVDGDDLTELFERQRSVDQHDARSDDVDVAGDEGAQSLRHAGVDFEPDDRSAAAPFQRAFEQPHQVFGLFLDFDVAVANDAEAAVSGDLVAGEELIDEGEDDLLEQHEAQRPVGPRVWQLDEAVDAVGKTHQRVHRPMLADALELQRQVKPRLGMKGNGWAGSTASGVRTGKTWRRK